MADILLYPHNDAAYTAAVSLLSETGKAAIVHPTGTGKSYIAFKLAAMHRDACVCWLSPSEYIYKTQMENLRASFPDCTLENVRFFTYSKLILLSDAEIAALNPSYIILDEFHRCGAEKWGEGVGRLLSAYPNAQVLGLSATNIRYLDNKRDMADELFDGNVASEMTLGEAIVRGILPAPQYITSVYSYQNELEKYKQRIASITERPMRDAAQKYLDALRRALDRAEGLDVTFAKYMHRAGKYLIFCSSREHMREMQSCAKDWFAGVDAAPHLYTVYSDDPETSEEFAAFKADNSTHLKLLFCINMLNEGIHVSDIDGVILFRPTVSPIIYKQQIGRALSAGNKNTPQIFDVVNNFQNLNSICSMQDEMTVAAARYYPGENADEIIQKNFKIYDEVQDCRRLFDDLQTILSAGWEQHFIAAKRYFNEYGNLNIPNRYKTADGLSLGSWLVTQRRVRTGQVPGNLTTEKIAQLDGIGMVWENKLETAWERNFAAAKEYAKQYKNLDVSAKYTATDGTKLGAWISNQRQSRLTGLLNEERIAKLDEIGMQWSAVDAQWEKNYAEAVQYFVENGDLDVRVAYKTESGFALGVWIRYLRRARLGKNSGAKPTDEQVARLDHIGMYWGDSNDAKWQKNYEAAKKYYRENGNLNVVTTYKTPDGIALGKWVYNQRTARMHPDKINNIITDERVALLDEIGMDWQQEDSWETRYRLAQEYAKQHGDLKVPATYKTKDGIWLGNWLYQQRRIKNGKTANQKLTYEQAKKLEALGLH
ncbi:MAG: Helicase associated domain protein [Ruthenibacterium sp.]